MTPRLLRRRDEGIVSVFVVVFASALVMTIALVLDGGRMLAARRQANFAADSAARAGAQAISDQAFRQGAEVIVDPDVAHARACALLGDAGYPCGAGSTVSVVGNEVTVVAVGSVDMSMLPIGNQPIRAEGSACIARGITGDEATADC
ncbi:MAG TPA: pilus assembly protein TadG-related protein [Acidimicrobiales bacterium]|nr:pilus assembly protein TadG-related protein [Acidimicrobiales bacterium]